MSISTHAAEVLELPKVLERLAACASFSASRALALTLAPLTRREAVIAALAETTEARRALEIAPNLNIGSAHDVKDEVEAAAKGAKLDAQVLLRILATLRGGSRLRTGLTRLRDEAPGLAQRATLIEPLREIEQAIARSIGDDGAILDSASPKLAQLRADSRQVHDRLLTRLQRMVNSPRLRRLLQEPIFTERSGRYVVPIKQESRSEFEGIVHDVSSSGGTVFMEPLVLVAQNNEWRRLRVEEKHEEERVLQALSAQAGAEAAQIQLNVDLIAGIDLALAKAKYAFALGALEPLISPGIAFNLLRARHPLLGPEAVPIDIRIDGGQQGFRALLITGPNTGGKTVALKTVGLLQLMAACGLHLPAADGSSAAVYGSVYADIGDEQSIEQSLSTFSSHMRNLVEMVKSAGPDTLVLADEIGAGTDPVEGVALAQAIVEHLLETGCALIATTHFAALKTFAFTNPLVENASVEFDSETLAPTFELRVGLPGRSNALEIAGRLGLQTAVVQRARGLISGEHIQLEDLMASIRHRADAAEQLRQQSAAAAAEADESLRRSAGAEREAAERIDEEWRRTRRETRLALREMEALAKETRRAALKSEGVELATAVASARRLQNRLDELDSGPAGLADPVRDLPKLRAGDKVRVRGVRGTAEVLAVDSSGRVAEIALGRMRMRVAPADLEPVQGGPAPARPRSPVAPAVPMEITPLEADVRGIRAEAAADEVDRLLDQALLQSRTCVRLIHGKGTGALRETVRRHLAAHPLVKSFADAGPREGGSGVTVVTLSR